MAQFRIANVAAVLGRNATKVATGLALCALVGWLAASSSNPWRNFTNVQLGDPEVGALRTDIVAAVRAVQPSIKVNVNSRWERGAVNVYVLANAGSKLPGWGAGGASYQPRHDVVLIDKHVAWPYVTEPSYAAARTASSPERSASARLWLQFIVLHEIGHRTLHRNVSPTTIVDQQMKRRFEDEADTFAFEHLASLVGQTESRFRREGLFSQGRIARLPEPDRSAAIIASLIQEFSVNLLFSNAAVSTYHSDVAHRAFADDSNLAYMTCS
jgi:hypothetical protein